MTAILGRTGNLVGFSTGRGTTPWDTEMEAALRKMDALLASTVVAITNTLPGSANEGDLYLVGTSPTGVAAGWANRIARWRSSPAGWEAYQPMQGWIITIVGESTDKVRRYNGTAWVALAADAGAEPYAGVPAQPSFWRSTAAGVRAWVQLVAADITDLATTLAGYLTKTNPTYTGNVYGAGSVIWRAPAADHYFSLYGIETEFGLRDLNNNGSILNYPFVVKRGVGGEVQIGYSGGIRPVRIGGAIRNDSLAGTGIRPLVALADGTLDDQDAATFRGTIGAGTSSLALGETSSTAYRGDRGKVAYNHSQAAGNPHNTQIFEIPNLESTLLQKLRSSSATGAINFHDVGGQEPGVYSLQGSSWTNGWSGITNAQSATLLQMVAPTGHVSLLATDHKLGGLLLKFQASEIPGDHWSPWFQMWDSGSLPAGTVGRSVLAATTAAAGRTAIDAAKKPSKLDVSASTTLGAIDATAIKVTTTDVILTLSGGVDGQGWDVINPTTSTGIAIPSGATLWKSIGSNVGPTTIALGGGRPIRITRIDANTWTMLGSQ